MEYKEYQTGNNLNAVIQGFGGGSVLEENQKTRLVNKNMESSEFPVTGNPSSSPYPLPETALNSMENLQMEGENIYLDGTEGKNKLPLVAKPPPNVMTSLGPMPLPVEVRRKIPEKFVAKPIIEEREIYVAKKEVQERTVEIPHIQYEHKFSKVPKMINIKKLVPSLKEIVREVPREVYKPVIEEKVIEVPQGVKYVEVPVEVPCFYPPKIVPKPKIKTVEVPYFVPKYVEKIIEVPYQPGAPNAMLPPLSSGMPPNIQGIFQGQMANTNHFSSFPPSFAGAPSPFKIDASFQGEINLPYEAKIDMNISNPQKFAHPSDNQGYPAQPHINTSIPIELPTGVQWGAPPNAPPPPSQCMPQFLDYPSSMKMPPMMVTFPPEVGQVTYCGKVSDPDILTRTGVMPYKGFKKVGTAQILFPPLPYHSQVPMKDNGVPDVETINGYSSKFEMSEVLRHRTDQSEEFYSESANGECFDCIKSNCCSP